MDLNQWDIKSFANTMSDAVFIMDVNHNRQFVYAFINNTCKERFGYSEDIIGKTIEEGANPVMVEYLNHRYREVLRTGETVVYSDTIHGRIDETKLDPVINRDGRITQIIAVTRNITTIENQRQALLRSNQRYQSLFDYNKAGIFELDKNGRFTSLNPAGTMMLGLKEADMMESSFHSIVCMEDLPQVSEMFERSLEGETVDYQAAIIDAKGDRKRLDITHVPMIVDHSLVGVYGIARDITSEQRQQKQIEILANQDQLTGMPNRSAMKRKLKEKLRIHEQNDLVSVLVLDVDDFKLINDSVGHDHGDELILELSRRLSQSFSEKFDVGRIGGDEFMLIGHPKSRLELSDISEVLDRLFAKPFHVANRNYYLKSSCGVTVVNGQNHQRIPEDVMKQAEMAMYSSKKRGRGLTTFYDESMNEASRRKLFLEQELQQVLQERGLEIYYQPILEAKTGQIKSFEALARWHHHQEGAVSPSEFIPVAEESGLIHELGEFVLDESLSMLSKWRKAGHHDIRISVNLSVKQLEGRGLLSMIQEKLNLHDLSPHDIELEITETAIMENIEKVRHTLDLLQGLGIYLSIDDFGTGYSSMSSLNRLPFHTIKIDRSFITDVMYVSKSRAILRSMIQLASEMGMTTIAEGVETKEQFDILRDEGVSEVQGYYFTKPVSACTVEERWLRNPVNSGVTVCEKQGKDSV